MSSDESLEILLNCKDMGLVVTKAKYFDDYIFDLKSYRIVQGILRINLETNDLKMFMTSDLFLFLLMIKNVFRS